MNENNRKTIYELAKYSDLDRMAYIEQACFPNYEKYYTIENFKEWYLLNPNMFHVIKDAQEQVIAFIIVTPINEALKENLESGLLSDLIDFPKEDILLGEDLGYYYVADICVDPKISGLHKLILGGKLMGAIFNILSEKNAQYVYSSPISSEGQKALENFGFEVVAYNESYPIYMVTPQKIMESRAYKMLRR